MQDLTTAQIIFSGLAGMEDAQIKSGNGLVERETEEVDGMEGMSVSDYAKMRQSNQPGSEIFEEMRARRERQKPMRAFLETRVHQLVAEDMKNQ